MKPCACPPVADANHLPVVQSHRFRRDRGFALVVTLSLMVLLTLLSVGLLSLAGIELRRGSISEARATAMANARMAMMLAIGQLQRELGDDRRITADASILRSETNPAAVGVWNSWSPNLGSRARPGTSAVDYKAPKGQNGFRTWLGSAVDPMTLAQLDWHKTPPTGDTALLFDQADSGFNLSAEKIPVAINGRKGALAWAVSQENTKARVNIATNNEKRRNLEDQHQSPARPNLALSQYMKQPESGWDRRSATIATLPQIELEPAYQVSENGLGLVARDYTVDATSLLTNAVTGGLKVDLSTAFDLTDSEFTAADWGGTKNPFRATAPSTYKGQKPLYQPLATNAVAQVFMDFSPASVNHKFTVNGVPTFDMLRSFYRTYRHLYGNSGAPTAFERPYSHVAAPTVSGRPFGVKTQSALAPVLDRMSLVYSIYAKADGTLCILLTPFVTIWNPHNIDIETEGLVVYPWIDFAVFWNWNVSSATEGSKTWNSSLSRFVGEGFQGHGRSTRPYFYLHLTESGKEVSPGARAISPPIRLEPGEVRVFCLAETARRDLEILQGAASRTWRMRPVASASDMTSTLKGGIVLNMLKSIGGTSNFNYRLKPGDFVNSTNVEFDRSTYYYVVNMADSYQIKNRNAELMAESRSAYGALPALNEERNLYLYAQVHSHRASGKGNDAFTYPRFRFEEINENPRMVGSMLTYHRVAQSSRLPLSDLMFTTNPRQPFINQYLSGVNSGGAAQFQTAPHYESLMQGGTSLSQLAMETTSDGRKAFYGPSHSASSGRPNLAFFEVPQTPLLSLGAFQHCDLSATAFGCPSQVGNSWASPYLSAQSVARSATTAPNGESITPNGLSIYDHSYLANEALFDGYFFSGAAPEIGSPSSANGSPAVWDTPQVTETTKTIEVLDRFFKDPVNNPLRNPRMVPHRPGLTPERLKAILDSPARCTLLAAYLMVEGGFNINSTSEEAWTAVLASLRGADPADSDKTPMSRFRHILTRAPISMAENDPWSGFRTLTDTELRQLAKNLIEEVRLRGPFLSLGEFVNRRISNERAMNLAGALQNAIDKSGLNKKFRYATFNTAAYPFKENLTDPNTGTNTPGWLSQADVLNALSPYITPRSDTFTIRALGEARNANGEVIQSVRLEAVVQRVPEFIDPVDRADTAIASLTSKANQQFGRRFQVVSIREIRPKTGNTLASAS